MMPARLALLGLLALCACACGARSAHSPRQRALPAQWHEEASYGFTSENPIRIGGGLVGEALFFEALRGPEGQPVAWRRVAGCCEFETFDGLAGLDIYEVIHEGLEHPVTLYLDVYHSEPVYAPRGFTISPYEEQLQQPPEREAPGRKPEIIEL
jgi:hypothetical protein